MSNQNLKPALAFLAWRNNGTKAPISVRFTQEKENLSANKHQQLVTRAIGIRNKTSQNLIISYTEDMFNEDFAEYGFTAEMIVNPYRSTEGNITAHELNVSTEKIFGEPIYISRYESTNIMESHNVDEETGEMSIKPGWSEKTVNGQTLTHKGDVIYSTYIFTEDGVDMKVQHDQDLRRKPQESVKGLESKVEAEVKAPF
jgi:hypothetical protein